MTSIRRSAVVVLCLAVLGIGACAPKRLDLVERGAVTVEKVPSANARISAVNVHQQGEDLEVEVVVRPSQWVRRFSPGAVEIEILDPEGRAFSFTESQSFRRHRDLYSKLQQARFWARLPYRADPRTVIRVTHLQSMPYR